MSEMFIKDTVKVMDKRDGKVFDCFPQMVDINFDHQYTLRYNIGINGYNEWSSICCVYDNETFNDRYEVVVWNADKKKYIKE